MQASRRDGICTGSNDFNTVSQEEGDACKVTEGQRREVV